MKSDKYHDVALEVAVEASRAGTLFPPMNSPHEASAVIREEFDEYWDEVKKHNTSKPDRDTRPRQREELIQLAAMCIRAITDTIDSVPKPKCYQEPFSGNMVPLRARTTPTTASVDNGYAQP